MSDQRGPSGTTARSAGELEAQLCQRCARGRTGAPAASRRLGWLGLLLLALGCSSGPAGPGDGAVPDAGHDAGKADAGSSDGGLGDGGLPVKSACTVLNARRCDYLLQCELISSAAVRDCLAWQQATSCGPSKWQARVEPPISTLRYDPLLAQSCADTWLTRRCTDFALEPGACGNRFLLPNVFPNQACYDGYKECTSGVCRGTACPRSCQPLGAVTEICRESTDCRAGLFCKLEFPAIGSGRCTAYSQATQACDADQPCGTGLLCSGGKCVLAPAANQPCLGGRCDEGSWCMSGADGGQCLQRTGLGTSCTDDAQCQPSLLCEVLTGQCVARTLSSISSVCGLRQSCPLGTVCLHATPTALGECLPPLDAGAGCLSSNDCQSHLACTGLDGGLALGCGPRQPDGMRCSEHRDCQLLSICRQQTCVRLPTTGDSCEQAQRCLFGPCVTPPDAGSICTEPFGPGVPCTRDGDCSSGRCVSGKCLPSCTP